MHPSEGRGDFLLIDLSLQGLWKYSDSHKISHHNHIRKKAFKVSSMSCSETWGYVCFKPVQLWVFLSSKVIHMNGGPTVPDMTCPSFISTESLWVYHCCPLRKMSLCLVLYTGNEKDLWGRKRKKEIQWFCKNCRGWWGTWKLSCMRVGGSLVAFV